MSSGQTTHIVLDAGAFVAWERNDKRGRALVQLAEAGEVTLRTSSGIVAQVWRGGSQQERLARLLGSGTIERDFRVPLPFATLIGESHAHQGSERGGR